MPASATALLGVIDWDGLPEDVRDDIRLLGPHIADGHTAQTDLACRTGLSADAVKRRLDRIREAFTVSAFDHVDQLDPHACERLLGEIDQMTAPRR